MEIRHPDSGVLIKGSPISAFEGLKGTEFYASRDRTWKPCPKSHCTMPEGNVTLWVRPD